MHGSSGAVLAILHIYSVPLLMYDNNKYYNQQSYHQNRGKEPAFRRLLCCMTKRYTVFSSARPAFAQQTQGASSVAQNAVENRAIASHPARIFNFFKSYHSF